MTGLQRLYGRVASRVRSSVWVVIYVHDVLEQCVHAWKERQLSEVELLVSFRCKAAAARDASFGFGAAPSMTPPVRTVVFPPS